MANLLTWAIQAENSPAHAARQVVTALLNEGVIDKAGGSFRALQDTGSNMQVKVGSGTAGDLCVIEGDAQADQGSYIAEHQDATATIVIAASDPSDPRLDLVIAKTYDNEADSSGLNKTDIEVVQGTPAAVPSAPALPSNAISLALIEVGAGVTAITNSDITDTRVEAALRDALLPEPPNPVLGVAEVTSGTAATLTLTIPAGYAGGVRIVGQARGSSASRQALQLRINGDAGSNYLAYRISAIDAGSPASSFETTTFVTVGVATGDSDTAGRFGTVEIVLPRISGTGFRNGQFMGVGISGGSTAIIRDGGFAWTNTGAITSLTLLLGSGSFVVGSRFELLRT